jgi:protein gp37
VPFSKSGKTKEFRMAFDSAIEWTKSTWNPVTGCTKISQGCAHCYAERMARRLQSMGQSNYVNGFRVAVHEHVLELPLRWKKSQIIFVNSMSDLFHEDVPTEFILRAFDIMNRAHWHVFQLLTKRSKRLRDLDQLLPWAHNIWAGVTVENQNSISRIDDLTQTGAATKFLSLEPLLSPLPSLKLDEIHWVIVGGESGPSARPMERSWVIDIRRQCRMAGIPFFFKQWGGTNKKRKGRLLDGRTWDAMPRIEPANSVRSRMHA